MIGVEQGTISAWEVGRQFPGPGREMREKLIRLAELLGIDQHDLFAALEAEKTEGQSENLPLSEDEFLTWQQDYIKRVGPENLEVWFLSPRYLPVIESPAIRARWVENLKQGTSYCLVWFLDTVLDTTLRKLAGVMNELSIEVGNKPSGMIRHYATAWFTENNCHDPEAERIVQSNRNEYETVSRELKSTRMFFFGPYKEKEIPHTVRHALLNHLLEYGPTVIYRPKKTWLPPAAASRFWPHERVKASSSEPYWHLLSSDEAYNLSQLAERTIAPWKEGAEDDPEWVQPGSGSK